ncbi:MAG: phosphatase PAP2 family protein [Spirochaetaceae bacterium]|nr:phosphatase PAP2 family protein [Spirochaetaceae bacterium]
MFLPSQLIEARPPSLAGFGSISSIDKFDAAMTPFAFNKGLDTAGDVMQIAGMALSAIALIPGLQHWNESGGMTGSRGWDSVLTFGAMYAEAFMLTAGTKDLLKLAVRRYRPYTHYGNGSSPYIPAGEEDDYYLSFPSGHSAYAFMSASFLSAYMLWDWEESGGDAKWKWPVIIGSYLLAGTVAGLRIAAGAHYMTDVLAGAAIGSLYGWLVPVLHLKLRI